MNAETNAQNMKRREHRAVAPIIATLLMVAIAVVGGILVFVFAQGFFSQTQISSAPQIESIEIIGFDARDFATQVLHSGTATTSTGSAITTDNKLVAGDNLIVYVKNNSPGNITFSAVSFAGLIYLYDGTGAALGTAEPAALSYGIVLQGTSTATQNIATLPAGAVASIVLDLIDPIKVGRDAQIKMTTSKGNVFVDSIVIGVQRG